MEESILTAHRGLTLASPQVENTLEAVKTAIANPEVGAIEIDIQLTKDGVFVLNNYKTLQNIITLKDPSRQTIADYTYEELCKMSFTPNMDEIKQILETGASEYGPHADKVLNWCKSVLSKQSRVTRLEDVLALDRKGKMLFIEIKTNYRQDQRQEINDYVRKLIALCKNQPNISFIGRDINTLEALKTERQDVPIMPVIGWTGIEMATHDVDGISAAWDALEKQVPGTSKQLGELILDKGMGLSIWNILLQKEYDAIPDYVKNSTGAYLTGNFPELIGEYKKK